MTMKSIFAGVALLAMVGSSVADEVEWGEGYDTLIERSGASIEVNTGADGVMRRTIILPNDVKIAQIAGPNGVRAIASDGSGLGAVHCAWMIYTEIANALQICEHSYSSNAEQRMNDTVSRIGDFMVENSYGLMTQEELRAARASLLQSRLTNADLEAGQRTSCAGGDLAGMMGHFMDQPDEALTASVDKLLSKPRFPVMNPCL